VHEFKKDDFFFKVWNLENTKLEPLPILKFLVKTYSIFAYMYR